MHDPNIPTLPPPVQVQPYPQPYPVVTELHVVNEAAQQRTVSKTQGRISLTRLFIALMTLGLSIPFLGIRIKYKTVSRVR